MNANATNGCSCRPPFQPEPPFIFRDLRRARPIRRRLLLQQIPLLLCTVPAVVIVEAVSAEQGTGPFGAKGVGESGTFGVSPAIANAIHDAVGVRLTSLPLNPEAVYMKLRERK